MSTSGIIVIAVAMLVVVGLLALPVILWQNTRLAKLEGAVASVAAEAGLGTERSSYRPGATQIAGGLWKSALAAAVMVAVVVTFCVSSIGKDLPSLRWVVGIPVGLLAAVACLYALYLVITAAGNRIHLFDGGLVHLHPTKQARVFRWDAAELHGGIGQHVKSHGPLLDRSLRLDPDIKVRRRDGAELKVSKDSISDGAELISTIQDNVTHVRLQSMMRNFADGHRLEFAPFVVDQHGVTTDGTTARWPDISGFVYTRAIGLGCVSLTHSETDASGGRVRQRNPQPGTAGHAG